MDEDILNIDYDCKFAPTIAQFHASNAFLRGIMGPFGSGKSSACVWEIMRRAMLQTPGRDGVRRSRWACVRKTYPQLQDTTQKTFFDWIPHGTFGNYVDQKHNFTITRFPHPDGGPMEVEIMFRALELEKHVENLLSLELTGAWINEARDFPQNIVNGIMGRVGRFPSMRNGGPTWHGVIADTNPPDDESWWYKIFEEKQFENLPDEIKEILAERGKFAEIFKQPSGLSEYAENLPHLVKGYYHNLVALNPPDWVKVYVLAEYGFVQDGRPVYPDYNDSIHCAIMHPIPGIPILRGWDFGLSPAVIFGQVHPNGRLVFLDEIGATNASLEDFSEEVKEKSNRDFKDYEFEDVGDETGGSTSALNKDKQTSFDILETKKIRIRGIANNLTLRLESVKSGLSRLRGGLPQIQVDPKCRKLRKGFLGRYRYRKRAVGEEVYNPKPEKDLYSHYHDGAQYIAVHVLGPSITRSPRMPDLPGSYDTTHHM